MGGLYTETVLFILPLWEKRITLFTLHRNQSQTNLIFKSKLKDDLQISNTILRPLLTESGLVSLSYRSRISEIIPESLPYESRFSKSESKSPGWRTDQVFILFVYNRQTRYQIPCKQDLNILGNNLVLRATEQKVSPTKFYDKCPGNLNN